MTAPLLSFMTEWGFEFMTPHSEYTTVSTTNSGIRKEQYGTFALQHPQDTEVASEGLGILESTELKCCAGGYLLWKRVNKGNSTWSDQQECLLGAQGGFGWTTELFSIVYFQGWKGYNLIFLNVFYEISW